MRVGHCTALAQTCSNTNPIPSGYAVPCPVWSLSSVSVPTSGSLTLTATAQPGTNYIYTTIFISEPASSCQGKVAGAWCPFTLQGTVAYPGYSSTQASLALTTTQLQTLSQGSHYAVVWDWLWNTSKNCYVGPGLNQCNTGAWRVQTFTLGTSGAPTPGTDVFTLPDDGTMLNSDGSINVLPITKTFYQTHADTYDFLVVFTNAQALGNRDFFNPAKNDVSSIGRAIVDNTATFGSAGKLRGIGGMSSIDVADDVQNQPTYFWLAHELGHDWLMSVASLPSGTHIDDGWYHFSYGLLGQDRFDELFKKTHVLDHKDGTNTYTTVRYSVDHMAVFHPFALYLMGLIPPPASTASYGFKLIARTDLAQLPTYPYYENGRLVGTQLTFTSTSEWVTVSNLIAAAGGPRSPDYTTSQKDFTVGYILVNKVGTTPTATEINRLNTIAEIFPQKWNYATQGKSNIISTAQSPATKLVFTSSAQVTPQGGCSAITTLQARDASGNPVNLGALTPIRISGTPIVPQVFSDPACSNPAPLAIQAGANSASFYYEVPMDGPDTLAAYGAGMQVGTQTETIRISPTPKFVFLTPSQSLASGSCSGKTTVQLQNATSTPVTLGTDVAVTFSGSPVASRIFGDPACMVLYAPALSAGLNSISFYFSVPITGIETLTVSGHDVQSGTQVETVQ